MIFYTKIRLNQVFMAKTSCSCVYRGGFYISPTCRIFNWLARLQFSGQFQAGWRLQKILLQWRTGLGIPDNCIFVFDLFSNTALRFEQFTLSLPYKASGKYHLAGNVCSVLSAHLHKATTVVAAKPQAQKVELIGESNLHNCLPHIQLASKSTYS